MGHFSISVIGKDRPGIVASVSEVLYKLGCNLEDSSCSILGGQFAMIVIFWHDEYTTTDEFVKAFQPLIKAGLTITVNTVKEGDISHEKGFTGKPFILSVYGADRPGIVYRVSSELAQRKVNITDLNTQLVGTKERPIYVMLLEIDIPDSVDMEEFQGVLEEVKKDLNVNVTLKPIETMEL
ncbi:MAG: amino acid-binding protein [Deltaproteobacteria bacterium]|nr:amino acid-binding protein [Deltaproteobacteria bacterium]NIS77059.1 amino acid-binding protein [Deltaproteobacteria bacterium]